MYAPTATETAITMSVRLTTVWRVGHATLRSSDHASARYI